jgi:hypothetical protein
MAFPPLMFARLTKTVTDLKKEHETLVEWYWYGKAEVFGEKPILLPLFSPQIQLGLAWD